MIKIKETPTRTYIYNSFRDEITIAKKAPHYHEISHIRRYLPVQHELARGKWQTINTTWSKP